MTLDVVAVVVALAALYGVGLPVALLLPAPEAARWVHRIAVAPMLGIALAYPAALLLKQLPVRLHPAQLLSATACLWLVALLLRDRWWVKPEPRAMMAPGGLFALAATMWAATLWGYGLYLPNRDFKNHATFVADVAYTGSAAFTGYPLGLHTLLGWSLPTPGWNSVGVTAAAAFLAMSISLPLAMLTLGRLWDARCPLLGVLAGSSAVLLPGVAGAFDIGSVPILVGTACYAAACSALWLWFRAPGLGTSIGVLLCGTGLLFLHVSEAVALGLVLLLGLPVLLWRHRSEVTTRRIALLAFVASLIAAISLLFLRPLVGLLFDPSAWDVEANVFGVVEAMMVAFLAVASTQDLSGLLWLPLNLVGVWIAHRRRLSWFPVGMLVVPMALAVIAGAPWVPDPLRALSAPWYGAVGRIAYLASPPVILIGSLTIAAGLGRAYRARRGAVSILGAGAIAVVVAVPAHATIDQRRAQLAASLAGAGDTPEIAQDLARRLAPGEAVLAFEGDGGAMLFAQARIPLVGVGVRDVTSAEPGHAEALAIAGLGDVSRPSTARALQRLRIRYVVVGTTSLYWDGQWGITLDQLISQPEFSVLWQGTDVTVLRYEAVQP